MKRLREDRVAEADAEALPTVQAPRRTAALAWMRAPEPLGLATSVSALPGLLPSLSTALEAAGLTTLFPLQVAAWQTLHGARAHDLCIHAPTGSGKTLAYALPLVASLSGRVIRRLRALVVVPTHDLAQQVCAVLQPLCQAGGLSVGVTSGKGPLAGEAAALVLPGGSGSCVDVLVATPGRLVAHLDSTPGFTLEHLRMLVVDEADRLLRQAYQSWLPRVLAATAATERESRPWGCAASEGCIATQRRSRGGARGPWPRVVKVVVSATLPHDPAKLGRLALYSPRLLASGAPEARYVLAPQLRHWRLVVAAEAKPAALLVLLDHLAPARVLVFAGSVDATSRVAALLVAHAAGRAACGAPPLPVGQYSALQAPAERSRALAAFRSHDAGVLVASDAATRGLDVEGIDAVVCYDAPVALPTYLHRVGRTARAGRPGQAFTLLRPPEVRHFKAMLAKAEGPRVMPFTLPAGAFEAIAPACAQAVARVHAAE